jgi:RNA polymerase sigma-70 factor, ECF subfamily
MFGFAIHQPPDQANAEFEGETIPFIDSLFSAALKLTKNERDAEDLVQDTYLKAFRFFDKYEPGTNAKAWLFKILTNTFINRYRKSLKERDILDGSERITVYQRSVSGNAKRVTEAPSGDHLDGGLSDDVQRALAELPVDFRVVVTLADLHEFSYKEIAATVECPVGTVMSRLYRGRRLLQQALASYAVGEGIIRDALSNEEAEEPLRRAG